MTRLHTSANLIQMALDHNVATFGEEQGKWASDRGTLSHLTTTVNKICDKLRIDEDEPVDGSI